MTKAIPQIQRYMTTTPITVNGEQTLIFAKKMMKENPEMSQRELAEAVGVSVGGIHYVLSALIDKGLVVPQPTMALAYMIQAALHDAALTIANTTHPSEAAEEAVAAFFFLLDGIRRDSLAAQPDSGKGSA